MLDWDVYDPQLRQLHAESVSQVMIAKRLGLPRQTVRDRLKKLGLSVTNPKPSISPPQEKAMPDESVQVLPGQMSIEDTDTAPDDAVSAVADIVPVNGAGDISERLTAVEVQSLEHYERIIAQGIKTFVEVGHALVIIRDERLYRGSYGTFEDYLRQRWDLSRPYAYQLIDAAGVVENVSAVADIVPVNEAQARPLTGLAPEQQREVWQQAVETAPPSGITAKHVKETVKMVKTASTGTKTQAVKPFDVQSTTTKIKDLYMDWLKHCETDDALEIAQFFLNTLSDLAQGRGMQLHPSR